MADAGGGLSAARGHMARLQTMCDTQGTHGAHGRRGERDMTLLGRECRYFWAGKATFPHPGIAAHLSARSPPPGLRTHHRPQATTLAQARTSV